MQELTHDELDLVVMAGCCQLSFFRRGDKNKSYTNFQHCGGRVCLKAFLFLHSIGPWRYKAINASYVTIGVGVHGNKGKHHQLMTSKESCNS